MAKPKKRVADGDMGERLAFVLLVYDVADPNRLHQVARLCEAHGQRVQRSVFELHIRPGDLPPLQQRLRDILDPRCDKVRYYYLCGADAQDIQCDGLGQPTEPHRYTVV